MRFECLDLHETLRFFRVNGCSVAEKLARAHDGLRRRRFAAESGSICARSGTEGSRWLFLFFVDAVLLCFASKRRVLQ